MWCDVTGARIGANKYLLVDFCRVAMLTRSVPRRSYCSMTRSVCRSDADRWRRPFVRWSPARFYCHLGHSSSWCWPSMCPHHSTSERAISTMASWKQWLPIWPMWLRHWSHCPPATLFARFVDVYYGCLWLLLVVSAEWFWLLQYPTTVGVVAVVVASAFDLGLLRDSIRRESLIEPYSVIVARDRLLRWIKANDQVTYCIKNKKIVCYWIVRLIRSFHRTGDWIRRYSINARRTVNPSSTQQNQSLNFSFK